MQTNVLLSIKPEFAQAILNGEKTFELRRKIFRDQSVSKVIIYASSPVQRVVGEFRIKDIHEHQPNDLWELAGEGACVDRAFFDQYFDSRDVGYAVEVSKPKRYRKPKLLADFCGMARPPQSFCYLPA